MADGYACLNVDLVARLSTDALGFDTNPGGANCAIVSGIYNRVPCDDNNDIWGWTDPDDGAEYALIGNGRGTAFVRLNGEAAPEPLGVLPKAIEADTYGDLWRDIKVAGSHAYVVSEASAHGVQVFDLTRLRGLPADASRRFDADARYTELGAVHNIVAVEGSPYIVATGANERGYACDGGGLHIIDIAAPLSPSFAGCFAADGYTHDAQCLVYDGPDTDYVGQTVCLSANGRFLGEDFLSISDISDPAMPVGISQAVYPRQGYTHQGWLTEDRRYFLVNDETDEANNIVPSTRTIIFDVSDLDEPVYVGDFLSDLDTIDHNLYIRGNLVYQSNYTSGLRIYDLTDLDAAELTLVGAFDTYPASNAARYDGQWSNYPFFESGLIVASDQENGLFVLRPSPGSALAGEDGLLDEAASGLSAAYPNPFRATTALELRLGAPERVRAEAFDALGRRVAVLFDGVAAEARLALDGAGLPAGLYVVRVTGETFAATRAVTKVP